MRMMAKKKAKGSYPGINSICMCMNVMCMNGYVEVDENMKNSANDKVLKKIFRKLLRSSLRLAKILQRSLKTSFVSLCWLVFGLPLFWMDKERLLL